MGIRSKQSGRGSLYAAVSSAALVFAFVLFACGGNSGDSMTDPNGPGDPMGVPCGAPPYFTVLPVPLEAITSIPVVGGVDAPGHVLPTDHGAFFFEGDHVPIRAPGNVTVTGMSVANYLTGPIAGTSDYAIYFDVCDDVWAWFGHVDEIAPALSPSTIGFGNCRTYSTGASTIENCEAQNISVGIAAGEVMGYDAVEVDFGVRDERITNFYVSPERFGGPNHAVCMWDAFDAATQSALYPKLKDLTQPQIQPAGEPRCGTMAVDVANTAKGVWADPTITGQVGGDERGYMALVDYPYRPQEQLALSLGPAALGGRIRTVGREAAGRVNRQFEDVTADGLIYCYGPTVDQLSTPASWLLQLTSATSIRMEYVNHGAAASPCAADPSTWAFGASAVDMIR